MTHWRFHPATRIVVIGLVALVAIYLFVTFVYQGGRPIPAVSAETEQPPQTAAPGEPGQIVPPQPMHPAPAGQPRQAPQRAPYGGR